MKQNEEKSENILEKLPPIIGILCLFVILNFYLFRNFCYRILSKIVRTIIVIAKEYYKFRSNIIRAINIFKNNFRL